VGAGAGPGLVGVGHGPVGAGIGHLQPLFDLAGHLGAPSVSVSMLHGSRALAELARNVCHVSST
jgi:hypothetical protein